MRLTRRQLRDLLNEAMLKESVDRVLGAITGSKTSRFGDELYTVKHLSSGQEIVCDDNANNGYSSFAVDDFDSCLSNFGDNILFEM